MKLSLLDVLLTFLMKVFIFSFHYLQTVTSQHTLYLSVCECTVQVTHLRGGHHGAHVHGDRHDVPLHHDPCPSPRNVQTRHSDLLPIYGGVRTVRYRRIPIHRDARILCGDRTRGGGCPRLRAVNKDI